MDLSIITVNYNGKEKILDQIASVKTGADDLEYEQIISDNGSIDGSVEEIKKKFLEVRVIENEKNLGFGAANNRALIDAKGEFFLFLNPDMRILPGTLKKAIGIMRRDNRIGILGPKFINEKGEFNEAAKPRRFPGLGDQAALLLKLPHLYPGILNRYLYADFDSEKEQEVDSVRGSFMLMRRDVVQKLGWAFDPRYFIWFEDVDTCREVKKLGFKVIYSPAVSCIDYVGQTFKRMPGGLKQRWFTESMVGYFRKWEPWYKWMPIAAIRPLAVFLTDLNCLIR